MNNFDKYISLGYVCNVAEYLQREKKRKEAYVFDRFATPMWAIDELVKNNFEDFLQIENLKCESLFENSDKKYAYDSKYYIRVPLNVSQAEKRFPSLQVTTTRRKERFMNILNGDDSVLFIRTQEPSSYKDLGRRIEKEEYKEKYEHDEKHYLDSFSQHLKLTYPSLNFKILYLSDMGNFVDEQNNIVGIPRCECDYRMFGIGNEMKKLIDGHSEFLNSNL